METKNWKLEGLLQLTAPDGTVLDIDISRVVSAGGQPAPVKVMSEPGSHDALSNPDSPPTDDEVLAAYPGLEEARKALTAMRSAGIPFAVLVMYLKASDDWKWRAPDDQSLSAIVRPKLPLAWQRTRWTLTAISSEPKLKQITKGARFLVYSYANTNNRSN